MKKGRIDKDGLLMIAVIVLVTGLAVLSGIERGGWPDHAA